MELFAGLTYPLRALTLIRQTPRLWQYVLVPILVNVVVGIALYLGLYALLAQQLGRFSGVEGVGGALLVLAQIVGAVALAVGIGFLLVRFGVVLGAPWYGQLSEELEGILLGQAQRAAPLTLGRILFEIWRALQFEGKKLLLALSVWLLSLPLLLLPGIGVLLQSAVGISLGATISCLDFFDGPQERRRLRFRQKLATIRATLPASGSFGLVAFALVSIPLVNLLAIPLCVTAGNMFVIERALPLAEGVRREA